MVVITDLNPEPAGLDPLAGVILDFDSGVIGLDHLRLQHSLEHRLDHGFQQSGRDRHPVAHRRAGQLDSETRVDPRLTVKRQVIGIFADGDMSHEPRTRKSLLDRLGKPRRNHDVGLAAHASVLGSDMFKNDQRRGNVFELLADFLAHRPAFDAAIGASPLFKRDVMHNSLARQMLRQGLAAVTRSGALDGCGCWGRFGIGR